MTADNLINVKSLSDIELDIQLAHFRSIAPAKAIKPTRTRKMKEQGLMTQFELDRLIAELKNAD